MNNHSGSFNLRPRILLFLIRINLLFSNTIVSVSSGLTIILCSPLYEVKLNLYLKSRRNYNIIYNYYKYNIYLLRHLCSSSILWKGLREYLTPDIRDIGSIARMIEQLFVQIGSKCSKKTFCTLLFFCFKIRAIFIHF